MCEKCYTKRNNYLWPAVQARMQRRYEIWRDMDPMEWIHKFSLVLNHKKAGDYFRWFDSGDLQSVDMLWQINTIAYLTPWMKHWLPTKEAQMVHDFLREKGGFADNLTLRVSLPMFEDKRPVKYDPRILTASSSKVSWDCPAHTQGNKCGDCRKCWDKSILHVTYRRH